MKRYPHETPQRIRDVDELTRLLDIMADFPSNEQRARYLLSSNFLRDNGARLAAESERELAKLIRARQAVLS